jgi:hypothetical protein
VAQKDGTSTYLGNFQPSAKCVSINGDAYNNNVAPNDSHSECSALQKSRASYEGSYAVHELPQHTQRRLGIFVPSVNSFIYQYHYRCKRNISYLVSYTEDLVIRKTISTTCTYLVPPFRSALLRLGARWSPAGHCPAGRVTFLWG